MPENTEATAANTAPFVPPVLRILLAAWHGRYIIAFGTGVAIILAIVIAYATPPTFEATAGMVLLPSPVKQSGEEVSAMMSKGLMVADYEILLGSDGVLLKAVEEVRKL